MRRNRRKHRGFTLLEFTLAAAIIATLATSLYMTMSIGFRARKSIDNQIIAMREAAVVMDLIQQDFESVLPPAPALPDSGQTIYLGQAYSDTAMVGPFIGEAISVGDVGADTVEFYCLGRDMGDTDSPTAEGVRWVQLALRTDVEPAVLVRRVETNVLAEIQREPVEEVLADNIRGFAVRYFDGSQWLTAWDSTEMEDTLPFAVEVTIELDRSNPMAGERPYRMTRVIPISCGVYPEEEDDEP
jgi:prepilin-type N-terminal cleavage/methylation domain-containing protein